VSNTVAPALADTQQQNKRSSEDYYHKGQIAFANKDYDLAIDSFSESLRLSYNLPALFDRARSYSSRGRYVEAIADYT
jgi:tetratricopeptide (TPR) repeat protein